MTAAFDSPLAADLAAFLAFKRARGYRYVRNEFALRSFDRFLSQFARLQHGWRLEEVILAWLGSRSGRKPISVAMELSLLREFWKHLHRCDPKRFAREPRWPRLPTGTGFVPYVLSSAHVRCLLRLIQDLDRPRFRRVLYRSLFLVLYCTGLRFGEALRLRIRDVDLRRRVLFIPDSKGRSRWVPFHSSLTVELQRYLRARRNFVGLVVDTDAYLFVGANRRNLR